MNCLCITGAVPSALEAVAAIFFQAGMGEAAPAARHGDPIGPVAWHQRVLAASWGNSQIPASVPQPGRLWEQLAVDLFLANLNTPVWGWADCRSIWLLEFWRNFEPRLNFILVSVSPEEMLAREMANGTGPLSVPAVLEAWQIHHREMLRFHLRNPQRSLLVDAASCRRNPQALIARCGEQWALSLDGGESPVFEENDPDALALYLAAHLAQSASGLAGLRQELAASVVLLDDPEAGGRVEPVLAPEQIVSSYRTLRETVHRQGQDTRVAQEELALGKKENELLLLQLQQVQEELESVFLKQQASEKRAEALATERDKQGSAGQEHLEALKADQARQKEAEEENELLLLQLHQVQEELEHYFLMHQEEKKELDAAKARWQRMLQRNPGYCDCQAIEILPSPEEGAISWRLSGLEAAGRSFAQLELQTLLENGVAGFVFSRQDETSAGPLIRWPASASGQTRVTVIPYGSRANAQLRAETLLDLATSDWDLLLSLARLLAEALANPAALKPPTGFDPATLASGLEKFAAIIARLPASLRFDRVSLKREQVNPDYEHLWLHYANLSFGQARWPEFEFRLSCANVRPDRFGTHPKLEFPEESGQAPFDSWFVEAYDDFGAKLELRFALPESMDMEVWRRLSGNDRAFLAALTGRLAAMLATLEQSGAQLKRPWADWLAMAREIKRVLTLCTAPPPPAPPPPSEQEADPQPTSPPQPRKDAAKGQSRTKSKRGRK